MRNGDLNFEISKLGECSIPSPISGVKFLDDDEHVLYHSNMRDIEAFQAAGKRPPCFEMAGAREKIYFEPSKLSCGIVTCGGICPGLNDVIRAIVLSLYYNYGVEKVFGFRYGYEGLVERYGHSPVRLTTEVVEDIHQKGGTILGSSRGQQDSSEIVDTLEKMNIGILFTIGGDGTLRGAREITQEITKRKLNIAVVGVPKTIDNDISYVKSSFGFATAVSEARVAIYAAHTEAHAAKNGIGLVKLMGRQSGFIAAYATLATSDVNFCLIPEVPINLDVLLETLKERLKRRGHAVIVVAEGAGQNLVKETGERDDSGNVRFGDIGIFLKDRIKSYFQKNGIKVNLKYIDPSYTIRSVPANAYDSALCLVLGHSAVHAGMTGRTNMVVGYWNSEFTHVPIPLTVSRRKKIDPNEKMWRSVLVTTGQPRGL
jgi:6-phosphofructokinase 1